MNDDEEEKRKHERFDTEVQIFYQFDFDLETKVKYEKISKTDKTVLSKKYSATSRNVSAEGISFISNQHVDKGTRLHLEIYLPTSKDPIHMTGDVRWSKDASEVVGDAKGYATGVQLRTVAGKSVPESIYFDEEYRVEWSAVLEAVLGNYRIMSQERTKSKEQKDQS